MKIALIALYDIYSHAIRGLHSYLDKKGYEVHSFFFKTSSYTDGMYSPNELKAIIASIKSIDPDFVGIGVRSPLFPLFAHISHALRINGVRAQIIAGGPHATGAPETCLEYADYVVVGDGEQVMIDILSGHHKNGIVKGNRVNNLDLLPFEHYGGNTYTLVQKDIFNTVGKVSAYSSRGCFFKCSYCQESLSGNNPVRKSVDYFKSEVEYFKTIFPNMSILTLADSNFLYDMEWIEEFASKFSGMGLKIWCAGNARIITDEMIKTAKAAGVQAVRIGVQSGSQYLRKHIYNRKDSLDDILRVAEIIHKNGLIGHYDFIIESPYDTPETIADTRRFIAKLPSSAYTNKFELRYWPGTPITEKAIADGYLKPDEVEGNFLRFGGWTYIYHTVGIE